MKAKLFWTSLAGLCLGSRNALQMRGAYISVADDLKEAIENGQVDRFIKTSAKISIGRIKSVTLL